MNSEQAEQLNSCQYSLTFWPMIRSAAHLRSSRYRMGSIPSPTPSQVLSVAIIGAGPAGLGAAIALSELPDIQVDIYEKATELREVGAGIRIGYNCWKILELLGAADKVRGHHKDNVFHRSVYDTVNMI